ncbi:MULTISPECIES: DUF4331 domain-containing protein [Ramlibacter]|uniref:DUF4331 domain-containing protein n=1 Tax=Ramlibacter pinisoli TaxID=2682844 RepID=A0A6N8IRA9_9BURK|nr:MULTISPECIES: DUF4331 domain-containing protein [Ramlibacter]MBA2964465.1 DUF4331 domain-containing protein [Ramlibacter sp. CGMCC 1.13660]MVQ29431.1 DUF4331 domain-containing protein [Ramlibacter pinisoli]
MKIPLPAAGAVLALCTASASFASSHREAPSIAGMPKVDATDLYMFRSYEGGRQDYVTILANYMPFQDPQGGPNYYMFDPDALYEIHIDNNGDAKEDITFQFQFQNTSKGTPLTVGGRQVKIPLVVNGPVSGVNPDTLLVRETYAVNVVRGDRRSGTRSSVGNASGGNSFDKPVDNIGEKVFAGSGGYAGYAAQHIYTVNVPGCSAPGKIFVGQRKEPFYIAVGKSFDLFNLNPLGPESGGNNNDLEAKNVSTIAMELPIACLTNGSDPVIGAYTTASVRQAKLVDGNPPSGLGRAARAGGAWAQVSRLGMPLVNELVIGLDDKDRFNASKPRDDTQFLDYVTHPTLPALIQTLFPSAVAPTRFPRTDLVAAFLTGIAGLNRPQTVTPSEMLRLNTSIAPTAAGAQNPLGVAGGDNAGFPNGRRPADDTVDLSLRVAMGALCALTGASDTLQVGCAPTDAPAGGLALTDGVRKTAANYGAAFPYLTTPIQGNFNPPAAAGTTFP